MSHGLVVSRKNCLLNTKKKKVLTFICHCSFKNSVRKVVRKCAYFKVMNTEAWDAL